MLTCRNYFYVPLITVELCGVPNEHAGWKPSRAEFYMGTPTVPLKASFISHLSLNKHCLFPPPLFSSMVAGGHWTGPVPTLDGLMGTLGPAPPS